MFCLIQECVSKLKCIYQLLLHAYRGTKYINTCEQNPFGEIILLKTHWQFFHIVLPGICFSANYKIKFGNFVEFRLCFYLAVPIHKY